jgi:hypothetical protein
LLPRSGCGKFASVRSLKFRYGGVFANFGFEGMLDMHDSSMILVWSFANEWAVDAQRISAPPDRAIGCF